MKIIGNFEIVQYVLWSVVITLWLYWLWTRRHVYRFSLQYPGLMGFPIVGVLGRIQHVNYLIPALGKMFEDCKRNSICIWLGIRPVLLTADPEFIEQVLSSSELLEKSQTYYHSLDKLFGGGLVTSPVEEWTQHRKLINPVFQHKALLNLIPIFNKAKNRAIAKFDPLVDKGEYALDAVIQRLGVNVTIETILGKSMEENEKLEDDLVQKYLFLVDIVKTQILLGFLNLDFLCLLSGKYKKTLFYFYNTMLGGFLKEKISQMNNSETVESLHNNTNLTTNANDAVLAMKKTPSIFMDHVLKLFQNHLLTWNEIISETVTLITASFETTATTTFSALVMLAMHPEVQERLFEEIISVFPEKNFQMTYEDLEKLPYLDRVINETLRFVPSIPMIGRQVTKETQVTKDLILPKGLEIFISIFHLHRRKDIWGPNADIFDPDNFLPENLKGKHSHAFIPFSKGARNCIGWRYAMFSLKIILTGLIRNYSFTTNSKPDELEFITNISIKYLKLPLLQIHRRP